MQHQLRNGVTEREKLDISATYFHVTGEVEKEVQILELWTASYPRDVVPHSNLGVNYDDMGQYERALAEHQEALRLAPDNAINYTNVATTYINLNRLDDASATLDRAFSHKLDTGDLRVKHVLSCLSTR
jgi:Flp pilus assembly protein TadD